MFTGIGKIFQHHRKDIRLATIFLGLIIIPCGVLGYFSWRALENEKLFSRQRLSESYNHFARLAAREIDQELQKVEKGWVVKFKGAFERDEHELNFEKLVQLTQQEPLIASCLVLSAPGQVAFPAGISLEAENTPSTPIANESYVREHEIFSELVNRGEDLEYRAYELGSALASYREILNRVTTPQLLAMTESYIGRVQQKMGEWEAALKTFEKLLAAYPEARDLKKTYLRFVAQYQIAVCQESLDRDQQAIATLLRLNEDLRERSDVINTVQYSYFLGLIQDLAIRLLASPQLADAETYRVQFQTLAEQNKKRLSQKYFLQLLDKVLTETMIERKQYRSRFRYLSDAADAEPYLLAYRFLPDPRDIYITGVIGVQIDLQQLRQRLFPEILSNLKLSEAMSLAVLNQRGDFVIGTKNLAASPIATQTLSPPFKFWQVAVYVNDKAAPARWNFHTALGYGVISLLLLSILSGAFFFIRRAQYEAKLSRLKSTFVSNVSHELRTPLTSIKMMAELMEMQASSPATEGNRARTQQHLGIIRRECDRLSRLIENVLSFASIERGSKQFHFEYEDPTAVLQFAIDAFRPYADAEKFRLEVDIPNALPELRLDADAILQVMLNLLSNAVKYSDEIKEIKVRAFVEASHLVVEVTDRGIGIAATALPKIFDDFYRVDQRLDTRKQGGMGLGLTLTRHIVQAHGGEITARSEIGKGSTFRFTLPLPAAEPVTIVAPEAVPQNLADKSTVGIGATA